MTQAVMSRGAMTFEKSVLAQARLHQLIPGGAHTYARGSDQFPEDMTPVLVRGRGARVEDLDGNWLIEYGMGLRSVTLGHGYQPVVTRSARRLLKVSTSHAPVFGSCVRPRTSWSRFRAPTW